MNRRLPALAAALAALAAVPAMAHVGAHGGAGGHAAGLYAGFTHPWFGVDHLLAMVAVGLLAVRAGAPRALWLIPAGFGAGMLGGAALAHAALTLPGTEIALAASVIVAGLALAFAPRVALGATAALVACAGVFHDNAHIAQMSGALVPWAAGLGLATALLHALGIATGLGLTHLQGVPAVRVAGATLVTGFVVALLV